MIERYRDGDIVVVEMRREPANTMDTAFADALAGTLHDALTETPAGAVVLTGRGGVFSAGVDLFRLLDGGPGYLDGFLTALQGLFAVVREARRPIVAAINGHAVAGGCVLALGCDFRLMADGPGTIGLPELRVGVPFPRTALETVHAAVPRRHLREIVLLGKTYGPADALDRGLVDEVVPAEDLRDRAIARARTLAEVPAGTWAVTRRMLAELAQAGRSAEAGPDGEMADLDAEVDRLWGSDEVHRRIRTYLEATLGRRGP